MALPVCGPWAFNQRDPDRGYGLSAQVVNCIISAKAGKQAVETKVAMPFSISGVTLGMVITSLIASIALGTVGFVSTIENRDALHDELKPENLEPTAKRWFKGFGYTIADLPDTEGVEFAFTATPIPNHPVIVMRAKETEGYLTIQGQVTLAEQHQKILDKLPPARLRQITHDLTLELARTGADYMQASSTPLHLVVFRRQLPITNSLSQATVVNTATETVAEENLVIEIVLRDLGE